MRKTLTYGTLGFLFGTLGLAILAMLSLLHPAVEFLARPLMQPGRWLGSLIGGPDGSTGEALLLMFFNGILYACLFVLIRIIAKQTTGA